MRRSLWLALAGAACTGTAAPSDRAASVSPPDPPPLASPPAASAPLPVAHQGPLAAFYDGLVALERGERRAHLRIVWLGDSHAQADFWTGYVRRGLQKRFGNGGPGFVHLGYKDYRHDGLDRDVSGSWRFNPKKPATSEPFGDGAFGLGGILHAGFAGDRYATLTITDEDLIQKKLRWDLCYKLAQPKDEFIVSLGDAKAETIKPAGPDDIGVMRHLERKANGLAMLKVVIAEGQPDFCGVTIETDPAEHPGVVLDNLGINGARYRTALAWNERAWAAEVRRRSPDLFVFEYGGNEASDGAVQGDVYKREALELVARTRRIRPEASCLVLAPADRADAEDKIPPIVEALHAAADEAGCMFWNTYEVMGGKGSMRKWRDDERSAPDGIHFKPAGYAELGALLLADLMAGYQG